MTGLTPSQCPCFGSGKGVGVDVSVGVRVSVGVAVNVGVGVKVGVCVGVGVTVGPNNCPDPQPEIIKLNIRQQIMEMFFFMVNLLWLLQITTYFIRS
jgi:hypothetical protein